MSTGYKPGTVAVATVRGVDGVRVMRTSRSVDEIDAWLSAELVEGIGIHGDALVTDVCPLVVLDLDYIRFESFGLKDVLGSLRKALRTSPIADQIEAQTKPQRIPEPGEGGVVEASCVHNDHRLRWVRVRENWHAIPGVSSPDDWDSLIDPTLIRDGVN